MMNRSIFLLLACALLLLPLTPVAADDHGDNDHGDSEAKSEGKDNESKSADADKEKKPEKPKTLTVKPEPFKLEVTLKGVFEAAEVTEVALRPESWAEWTVVEAVAQGEEVVEGKTLVEFDTEKIDTAIADLEAAQAASELALKQADEAFRVAKKTVPLQLEEAERAHRVAEETLENFLETDKEDAIEDAHYNVELNENFFLYEQEELRQLEKMYKEDDVTEETEEIILLRLQHRIKNAKMRVERAKKARDRMLEYEIPRREAALRTAAETATLALEAARAKLPASLIERELALERLRRDRVKSEEKLEELRRDRAAMTILSPAAGLVYYGRCDRGRWGQMSAVGEALRPHGQLKPNMVVMTIVDPDSMFVRTTVEEKQLHELEVGVEAVVTPTAFPEMELDAELSEVSRVPIAAGKFDGRVQLAEETDFGRVVPGMACSIKLTTYENAEAILVPKAAIHDEDEGDGKFVYVQVDDKPEKRSVETGKSKDDKVEITDGLAEGDVLLLEKPAK
ncbi:MAG: HlyD family efflux transporter periplasmic adaptor subunit [Planctomycetota bacterium]|nr:MAG: HlyD family efflux transporter periplasmic adaptor subunit [Planctomycetota bacterium]REJ95774.1 MAG: HlyD family efflux transporter periplasmic adaptor subunit [Planctomycetota bacterium]REK25349.1 MAG: HlyD family efflux transporter periplasmic adaptor subunit [Planctomycetota bacterium]REK43484.1 MAG: HlyD family efflux transporter periplasmic adaptor subunit [Planctomycetota bacterium]